MSHAILNCKFCPCSAQCTNEQVGDSLLLRKTGALGKLMESLEKGFIWRKGGICSAVETGQIPRNKCGKRKEKDLMSS